MLLFLDVAELSLPLAQAKGNPESAAFALPGQRDGGCRVRVMGWVAGCVLEPRPLRRSKDLLRPFNSKGRRAMQFSLEGRANKPEGTWKA